MKIKDKVCLVTGSSIRVGKSIAKTLAISEARIVIHYKTNFQEAKKTADEIKKNGGEVVVLQGDISKKTDWINMRSQILRQWSTIDILVNNAAVFYKTPFLETSENDFSE